jgi:hypothetical protein
MLQADLIALDLLAVGLSEEEILEDYPGLPTQNITYFYNVIQHHATDGERQTEISRTEAQHFQAYNRYQCRNDLSEQSKEEIGSINGTSKPPNAGPMIPEMLNCKPLKKQSTS